MGPCVHACVHACMHACLPTGVLPRLVDHLFAATSSKHDIRTLVKRAVSVATGSQPQGTSYTMKRDEHGHVHFVETPSNRIVLSRDSALDVLHVLDRVGVVQGMPCKPDTDAGRQQVLGGRKVGVTPESMLWNVYRQDCALWAAKIFASDASLDAAVLSEEALLSVGEFLGNPTGVAASVKACACAVCIQLPAMPELLEQEQVGSVKRGAPFQVSVPALSRRRRSLRLGVPYACAGHDSPGQRRCWCCVWSCWFGVWRCWFCVWRCWRR